MYAFPQPVESSDTPDAVVIIWNVERFHLDVIPCRVAVGVCQVMLKCELCQAIEGEGMGVRGAVLKH